MDFERTLKRITRSTSRFYSSYTSFPGTAFANKFFLLSQRLMCSFLDSFLVRPNFTWLVVQDIRSSTVQCLRIGNSCVLARSYPCFWPVRERNEMSRLRDYNARRENECEAAMARPYHTFSHHLQFAKLIASKPTRLTSLVDQLVVGSIHFNKRLTTSGISCSHLPRLFTTEYWIELTNRSLS